MAVNPPPATPAIPAIVVVAYNRPESLARLLNSIAHARYPADSSIPLVISIDGGGSQGAQVQAIAENFEWPHGSKEIILHAQNLGLVEHVFACGDLSQRFGAIILLEDDIVVGRAFYAYAEQSLAFFRADPQVAGISLSALWFHGFTQLPFTPSPDAGDNFFMQIAWYQGQVYTADQWQNFRDWLATDGGTVTPADNMHPMFSRFPKSDWFPLKTRYLVKTGRFYAFPRESLAVNFGEMGTHFAQQTAFFQVPLQERKSSWRFQSLSESLAVYDSWQEMLPSRLRRLVPELKSVDFETDFYGQRVAGNGGKLWLTTQPSRQSEHSWGLSMRPPEANLTHAIEGDGIRLTRPEDVDTSWRARLTADRRRWEYFSKHRPLSRRARLKLWLGKRFIGNS